MPQPRGGRLRAPIEFGCGGPRLGELSGGNWMVVVGRLLPRGGDAVTGRACLLSGSGPDLDIANFYLPPGGSCHGRGRRRTRFSPADPVSKIVTWLILPVVICLSQRLSHACLSISNHTVKLRMAH
jgi:hypothetical protein